jgi:molybdate transport system permease protein
MKISNISRVVAIILAVFFIAVLIAGIWRIEFQSIGALLADQGFLYSVGFSLKTSLLATILAFITGVPTGFFLARNKGSISQFLDVVFDIPIVVPPLIVGVLLITFFNLAFVHDFYRFIFTTSGAVIAQFFVAVPFTIKSSKSAFELIPPIYERIAMTLGAKAFRSFYDTTFKIAFPGILSGVLLTWLRCLGEFGATLMVGGGIPGKTENIPINVYLSISSGEFEKGLSASVITIILVFVCILVINAVFLRNQKTL